MQDLTMGIAWECF
jgi:hypothetical protein